MMTGSTPQTLLRQANMIPRRILLLGFVFILVLLPFVVSEILLLGTIIVFATFAVAYNFLIGYSGVVSFGHAAFFAIGTYITVLAIQQLGVSLIPACIIALAVTLILAVVIGGASLQRRGLYFAMITLALGQAVYALIFNADITGGSNGLRFANREVALIGDLMVVDFSNSLLTYYVVLAGAIVTIAIIRRIVNSPFGLSLRIIRENEERAKYIGYPTTMTLLFAFVLSAGFTTITGILNVLLIGIASPTQAHWLTSGDVLVMTLLGGVGTFFGPIFGAGVFIILEEIFITVFGSELLPIGVVLLLAVMLVPGGVATIAEYLQE